MKKLKIAFWIVFIGFFALLVYQNLEFFSATHSLKINLGIYERQTPEMTTGAIMASFVGVSVLVMLIFYLASRYEIFRANKTIKSLTHTLDESSEMITNLKKELEMQQQGETMPAGPADETLDVPVSEAPADTESDTNTAPTA